MRRFALPVVAVLASSLAFGITSASAQTGGSGARPCAKDYQDFWTKFDREKYAKMSPEQLADLSRTALRGYDACTAGDDRFASDFFKKLDATGPNAKFSDIFKAGGDFDTSKGGAKK
jgi:hypothetical protein